MIQEWLNQNMSVTETLSVASVFMGSGFIFIIFRFFISRHIVKKVMGCESCHSDDINKKTKIYNKMALIAALIVILILTNYLPYVPPMVAKITFPVTTSLLIAIIAWFIFNLLDTVYINYSSGRKKTNHSIKGYVQLGKIIILSGSLVLIMATLADKSPLIILSSLGAAAAVILLLFQHTLISLVANLQVSSSNSIQLGDWVEIPQLNISGTVTDLALHTTTVQNWDNTVSRLPTKYFITEHFTNWQPMFSSGGRRIKRALYIDQQSIEFVDKTMISALKELSRMTNISFSAFDEATHLHSNLRLFREFITRYLRSREDIRQDMLIMVRQMPPGPEGLPLEIYCFTSKVNWLDYERIQAEIFDLLIPMTKYFSLRIYQSHQPG